jgi:tetratricopeptide (TPR) repeat protein
MEIDLYRPCPVHPEKKIKFCCGKEIATDLNQIVSKVQARQPSAALDLLNQLIDRAGPKDCLLTLKVQILMSMDNLEAAQAVNEQFLEKNPEHPVGLENRAIFLASADDVDSAYHALQDAMDKLPGSQIPVNFSIAFRQLALKFLEHRDIWPAFRHIEFALALNPDDELNQRAEMIIGRFANSLLLQRSLQLPEPQLTDAEWKKKYENAIKASRRGQFRKAGQLVAKALEMEPGSTFLKRAMAIASCVQPNVDERVKLWGELATCTDQPQIRQIEAESIRQYFRTDASDEEIESLKVTYDLGISAEEFLDLIQSNPRVVIMPVYDDGEWEGPPPKSELIVLDRDAVDDVGGLGCRDIPHVLGRLLLFGKQTDRPARVELYFVSRPSREGTLAAVERELGDSLTKAETEVVGRSSTLAHALEVQWHLPPSIDQANYVRLEREEMFRLAEEELPQLHYPSLKGPTLRELAASPDGKRTVQAVIARLMTRLDGRPYVYEWGRSAAQACAVDEVPIARVDALDLSSSPFEWFFSDLSGLDTKSLNSLFLTCAQLGSKTLMRTVAELLLKRDTDAEESISPVLIHVTLCQLAESNDEAFEHMATAKKLAQQKNQSVGPLLVQEFEQRLLRGDYGHLRSIIQEIRRNHINESGVADQLAMVLTRHQLITPEGQIILPRAPEEAPSGKLWTPDEAIDSGTGTTAPSKLWIPGE